MSVQAGKVAEVAALAAPAAANEANVVTGTVPLGHWRDEGRASKLYAEPLESNTSSVLLSMQVWKYGGPRQKPGLGRISDPPFRQSPPALHSKHS